MGKKVIKQEPGKLTSNKKIIAKRKIDQNQENDSSEEKSEENSEENSQENSEENSDEDQESGSDDQSQSEIVVKPQNFAIKSMQFRERRGTKMNELMRRKKQEEEDSFWQQQGQNYFGDLQEADDDAEDYVQSSSGRDEFDSDFDQTESEHEEVPEQGKAEKILDEDELKQKKKRHQLMKKVNQSVVEVKKNAVKTNVPNSNKKQESEKKIVLVEQANRYIHQVCTQEELLGQAATTEYFNWISLKKLISIECVKKDFTKRQHHIQGPKSIYRDKIGTNGIREISYQLQNVKVNTIQDLTQIWK